MHERHKSLSELHLNSFNYENQTSSTNNVRFKRQASNLSVSTILYNQIKSTTHRDHFHQQHQHFNHHHDLYSLYTLKHSYTLNHVQCELYHFFERPSGYLGFMYRCFTFTIILTSILFSAFTTFTSISKWAKMGLFWIELFATLYLFIEFCVRVWSAGYRVQYSGLVGRLRFISRAIMIIELLAFWVSIFVLVFGTQNYDGNISLAPTALTLLRILQLIRLLYVDRKAQTWNLLVDVVQKHRFELITSIYIGFIILLLSSYLILIFEKPFSIKNNDDQFHSYSDALYYSIITMTTIGYGDRTPRTFYGKLIATSLCILGVAFWTLPGGIIGSGLALKVEQKNKKKQFNRLVPAAACLIQNWWRMKALLNIQNHSSSRIVATLKVFNSKRSQARASNAKPKFTLDYDSDHDDGSLIENEKLRENKAFIYLNLNPEDLLLIRTILIIKFHIAKRKFKHAHKPYDFKDVIEQYTQGNMDILIKIKELQRKLDQTIHFQKTTRSTSLQTSSKSDQEQVLCERMNRIDLRLDYLDKKLDVLIGLAQKE